MGHRKMPAYGEREHGGRYILDEYEWSRNHCKAVTIRRWKRDLKKKARAHNRRVMHTKNGKDLLNRIQKMKLLRKFTLDRENDKRIRFKGTDCWGNVSYLEIIR